MGAPKFPTFPNIVVGEAARINIAAPDFVKAAISTLARTEDCRFSPNGKKLAIAGFAQNRIMVFDVETGSVQAGPPIRLTDYVELDSPKLTHPHGLDFVDDETLVVGNRGGSVTVFAIPAAVSGQKVVEVSPLLEITKAAPFIRLNSPGSVCVARASATSYELLVCNNYTHRITQHGVSRDKTDKLAPHNLTHSRIMLENGLRVPDGAALSADKARLAISNHLTHEVFIYDYSKRLGRRSKPHGTLQGIDFPHGLRFLNDDRYMLVADAGLPFVQLFHSPGGQWQGEHRPVAAIRVMDDETFLRGRSNNQEGGLKGLDLSPDGKILATTCETRPLAFFDTTRLFHLAACPP